MPGRRDRSLTLVEQLLDDPVQRQFQLQPIVPMGQLKLAQLGFDHTPLPLPRITRALWGQDGIQPTLTERPGLPVRIIVNRDLVLRPYQPLFFNRGASQ